MESPSSNKAWFGADPGGESNFGVALLIEGEDLSSGVVSSADQAVEWLCERLDQMQLKLCGVGIDAPMWLSSGLTGGRKADKLIRDTYGISSGTVQNANSLRGAVLGQGHMLAFRLREKLGELKITEVHPKALIEAQKTRERETGSETPVFGLSNDLWRNLHGKVLGLKKENAAKQNGQKLSEDKNGNEHQRDAIICAVAARESFSARQPWTFDLADAEFRDSCEQDPSSYWLGKMHYYWPEKLLTENLKLRGKSRKK